MVDSVGIKDNPGTVANPVFRRAVRQDADRLTEISRKCFPDELMWLRCRRKTDQWWSHVLSSDNYHLWVCQVGGRVVGFVDLVTDLGRYQKDLVTCKGGLWSDLLLTAAHPWRVLTKAPKILVDRIRQPNQADQFEGMEGCLWIEPIAVIPDMQGQGLGERMIRFAASRALDLGRNAIGLRVVNRNTRAVRLYKRLGAHLLSGGAKYSIYRLDAGPLRNETQ